MTTLEHPAPRAGDEPILSHHFDSLEQQHESSSLGMWAFLATEVLFFGGLILAYAVYRDIETVNGYKGRGNAFVAASKHLSVFWGGLNTVVLLTSSLTMALAVRCSQLGQGRHAVRFLLATLALGAAFLGIKAHEWTTDYREGLVPGASWDWARAESREGHPAPAATEIIDNPRPNPIDPSEAVGKEQPLAPLSQRAQLFFFLYFIMTGLHAFHMIVGIVLVATIAWLVHRGWFSGGGGTQVEMTGLYWHFVDIVWVFLYPLLYLIDVHK